MLSFFMWLCFCGDAAAAATTVAVGVANFFLSARNIPHPGHSLTWILHWSSMVTISTATFGRRVNPFRMDHPARVSRVFDDRIGDHVFVSGSCGI
jgi:hypothetical protein